MRAEAVADLPTLSSDDAKEKARLEKGNAFNELVAMATSPARQSVNRPQKVIEGTMKPNCIVTAVIVHQGCCWGCREQRATCSVTLLNVRCQNGQSSFPSPCLSCTRECL